MQWLEWIWILDFNLRRYSDQIYATLFISTKNLKARPYFQRTMRKIWTEKIRGTHFNPDFSSKIASRIFRQRKMFHNWIQRVKKLTTVNLDQNGFPPYQALRIRSESMCICFMWHFCENIQTEYWDWGPKSLHKNKHLKIPEKKMQNVYFFPLNLNFFYTWQKYSKIYTCVLGIIHK